MGLTEDLQALKARAAEAERRRARREADIELAEQHRDNALKTLKDEYGAGSLDEARKLAADLQAEVAKEVADAMAALEGVE